MSSRGNFLAVFQALRVVLGKPWYSAIAVLVSGLVFALMLWSQNVRGIVQVIASPLFSWSDTIVFLFRLLGGIVTNVTPLAAVLIIVVSVLFGINAALLIYSLIHRSVLLRAGVRGSTLAAMISAVFGAGCASCGTYLLGSVLASLGASGLLAFLPLGGQELLLVSIVLLLFSVGWVGRALHSAGVCPVGR
ncbi:MAG: hypothetical protein AAB538_05445 [Patescibacteria group bacterium]